MVVVAILDLCLQQEYKVSGLLILLHKVDLILHIEAWFFSVFACYCFAFKLYNKYRMSRLKTQEKISSKATLSHRGRVFSPK